MDTQDALKELEQERKEEAERSFKDDVKRCLRDIASATEDLRAAKQRLTELDYKEPDKIVI